MESRPASARSSTGNSHKTDETDPSPRLSTQLTLNCVEDNTDHAYPKADGGVAAWTVLAAAFVLEAQVWGFPFAYGVFERYFETTEPFASQLSGIASVGTTAMGMMYFSSPFTFLLFKAKPQWRRQLSFGGLAMTIISLVSASYANTVPLLVFTQGVLFGLGGLLLYNPAILYLDEWFIKRKGLAYGIMWAGTSTSAAIIPLVMDRVLNKYGHRVAFRGFAVFISIFLTPCLFVLRPRTPTSSQRTSVGKIDVSYVASKPFWYLSIANVLQSLGFFLPPTYLSSYARTIGLSTSQGTLVIALLYVGSIPGTVCFGRLADRVHVTSAMLISAAGSSLSVFCLWSFATSAPLLFVFSISYGFFGSGYVASWAGSGRVLKGKNETRPDTGMLIALFAAGKGVASMTSGPLSEALLKIDPWEGQASWAYGTGYGLVLIFTGLMTFFGGLSVIGRLTGAIPPSRRDCQPEHVNCAEEQEKEEGRAPV